MLLLLQICFYFVMRETPCLLLTIIKKPFVVAFNSTSRYLDDLLNIDNPYFAKKVSQTYPTELQLNTSTAKPSYTKAPSLDLDLSITNGIVSTALSCCIQILD